MRYLWLLLPLLAGCGGSSDEPATSPPPPVVVTPPPPPPPPVTCTQTLSWTLPTEDTDDNLLGPSDLINGLLYVTYIPLVEVLDSVIEVDAYVLLFERTDVPEGVHYYRMTVTNEHGESEPSDTVEKECK